eukprot:gene6614-7687_t
MHWGILLGLLAAAASVWIMQPSDVRGRDMSGWSSVVVMSDEVKRALYAGKAVVALESTIISHGMPYPMNYETARAVEAIVRDNGAVPATIALINGKVKIGLVDDELRLLALTGKQAVKTSRRDLAIVLASNATGSTTVSGTIFLANLVGIKVFVTGGLGGVHRGAEYNLTELGRNDVAVISAGVKSILDIGKTLEYLETQGVTVATYGADYFPSFFTSTSDFKTPNRLDTPEQCASVIHANHKLGLKSGIVIAVPNNFTNTVDIEQAITDALADADGFQMGTSNPGSMAISMGGVGKNVAETIARMQLSPLFISVVGDDIQSDMLLNHLSSLNMTTLGVSKIPGQTTATYNAIMNQGDLVVAMSIMDIFESITPSYIRAYEKIIKNAKIVVVDGNIPVDTMATVVGMAKEAGLKVFFEPTSVFKSTIPIAANVMNGITYASPNVAELLRMSKEMCALNVTLAKIAGDDFESRDITDIARHVDVVLTGSSIEILFVKAGAEGVYMAVNHPRTLTLYPAPNVETPVDVTGAGDSMVGCLVYSILANHDTAESMRIGTACAKASLESKHPVSPMLSPSLIL